MDERQMVNMRRFGAALAGAANAAHLPRLHEDGSDHHVISVDGWVCDVCGRPVNGQTDEDGTPKMRGDSVRHV